VRGGDRDDEGCGSDGHAPGGRAFSLLDDARQYPDRCQRGDHGDRGDDAAATPDAGRFEGQRGDDCRQY